MKSTYTMGKQFTPISFLFSILFSAFNPAVAQRLPAPLELTQEFAPLGHAKCIIKNKINCTDQTVTLQAFFTTGATETPLTVNWNTGQNAHTIVISQAGVYSYDDSGFGCDHHLNTIATNPFFPGNLQILGPPSFCPGVGIVDLTVSAGGYVFDSFQWTPNISDDLTPATILGPGTYSLQVVDQMGCPFNSSLTVLPSPPILPILSAPKTICTENDSALVSVSPAFASYQ